MKTVTKLQITKFFFFLSCSMLLFSCEAIGYYTQAAQGQLSIVFSRKNVDTLIATESFPQDLKEKFSEIKLIKEFAGTQLALPVGNNYSSYVDVKRNYMVWNVFAAPEFSMEPFTWCYPIAGCVSYRGYFSKEHALRYAKKLEDRGLDVYTGGVSAYSTLGWFDDSLTNTIINRSNTQLARLIFHELAHQVVYIPGDTTFNESFATVVELEGLRRWSESSGQGDVVGNELAGQLQRQQFVDLVTEYRDRLNTLYQSDIPDSLKRIEKDELQLSLRQEFLFLAEEWGSSGGYDSWFSGSLNNAQLSTVTSYNDLVPYFENLLAQSNGDLETFYSQVLNLAKLDEAQRIEKLRQSF